MNIHNDLEKLVGFANLIT